MMRQDTQMLMGQGYALVQQVRQMAPTPAQQELQQQLHQLMQQLQQQVLENGSIRAQAAAALQNQQRRCEQIIAEQSASFVSTARQFEQAAHDEKEIAVAETRNASHMEAAAITSESQRLRSDLEKAQAEHASYRHQAIATEHQLEEQLSQVRKLADNWQKSTEQYQANAAAGNNEISRLGQQVEELRAGLQQAQAQLLARDDGAQASDQATAAAAAATAEVLRLQLANQKLESDLQIATVQLHHE